MLAIALGLCLQSQDPQALIDKLRSDLLEERDQATEALIQLGPDAIPALKAALGKEKDGEVRSRIEVVLDSFIAKKLGQGIFPCPSPSSELLAITRWKADPNKRDMRGNPVWEPEVWIQDLARHREWRVCEGGGFTPFAGWRDEKTLILSSGARMDVHSGKTVDGGARLPEKIRVRFARWSPDGRQVVFVPDMMFYQVNSDVDSPKDTFMKLGWVDGEGKVRHFNLGHKIDSDSHGNLCWSPDGKRVAFDLMFFRDGDVPCRRMGVVELSTGTCVFTGEGPYITGGGTDQGMWDGKGTRFVFVTGRGGYEADIYIANADGSGVVRVTDDGSYKWCPVLDAAGRRVAFAACRRERNGEFKDCHLRVLDLLTGEESRWAPKGEGMCISLIWSPDGNRLLYDWGTTIQDYGVREARFSPPKAMPSDATIVEKKPGSKKDEVIKALGSEKPELVEWAAETARSMKDAEVVSALRAALQRQLKGKNWTAAGAVLRTLVVLDVREAGTDFLAVLDSEDEWLCCSAISILAYWRIAGAEERFRKILRETPEKRPATYAAAGLALLGDEAGWAKLREWTRGKDKDRRMDVANLLGGIRDPRSMDILLDLVEDREVAYLDISGDVQVGDLAEYSLAVLTGETFARDRSSWVQWWKKQDGKLPKLSGPNKGLETLERQRKLREGK